MMGGNHKMDYHKHNSAHLGARKLEIENVKLMLPYIENIRDYIDSFRNSAKNSYMNHQHLKELYYEKYDNFISILGDRGLGKTSIMLTIIDEIKSRHYFCDKGEAQDQVIDLIAPLLVPDDMSDNSDILGWIIVTLENMFYRQLKVYNTTSCLLNRDSEINKHEELVMDCLHNLKRNYHHRKESYKTIVDKTYRSDVEYIDEATLIQQQDLEIVDSFNHLIDAMINYKKYLNHSLYRCDDEPLIFFFFDDVDVTAQYCEGIFETFLTFLSNAHIVTFISGDYDLFLQSVTLKLLEKEKIYHYGLDNIYLFGKTEKQYQAIELIKKRAESFLKKVLPPMYRFEIRWLDNEKKSQIKYSKYESNTNRENLWLDKPIKYLLKEVIDKLSEKGKDNDFLVYKHIDIFPYYSVFSRSVRGFINVYLYLVGQINALSNIQQVDNKKKLKFMEEFLQVLLNSKNTYRKNLKNISRYLYIKKGEKNDEYKRLRIDCEELKEIIKLKIEEAQKENHHPYITDEVKDEIQALIMLPLFMNELQNKLFNKYENRYKRIRDKVKNIILYEFVNHFNKNITMFLPSQLDLEEILLLYSFITTRMSMEAIHAMNGDVNHTRKETALYNENNDKKYLVQIMKAIVKIYEGEISTNIFDKQDDKEPKQISDQYDNALYGEVSKRLGYEEEIMEALIRQYEDQNYAWLLYLRNLIINNLSLSSHLYPYTKFYEKIEPMYAVLYSIYDENEDIQSLRDVIDFCEMLKDVFNDKNLISYINESNTKDINQFYKEVLNFYCNKIENISYEENSNVPHFVNDLRHCKLIADIYSSNPSPKLNIEKFSEYNFRNQKEVYIELIQDNLESHAFEKIFLSTKMVLDYLELELNKVMIEYSENRLNEFFNELINNAMVMLGTSMNNFDFEKCVYNELLHTSYGRNISNHFMEEMQTYLLHSTNDMDVIDEICNYVYEQVDIFADTIKDANNVNRDLILAQSQFYMYLIPIYIVSTYLYDLNCTNNITEKKFFLNLLGVINKELENE